MILACIITPLPVADVRETAIDISSLVDVVNTVVELIIASALKVDEISISPDVSILYSMHG